MKTTSLDFGTNNVESAHLSTELIFYWYFLDLEFWKCNSKPKILDSYKNYKQKWIIWHILPQQMILPENSYMKQALVTAGLSGVGIATLMRPITDEISWSASMIGKKTRLKLQRSSSKASATVVLQLGCVILPKVLECFGKPPSDWSKPLHSHTKVKMYLKEQKQQ